MMLLVLIYLSLLAWALAERAGFPLPRGLFDRIRRHSTKEGARIPATAGDGAIAALLVPFLALGISLYNFWFTSVRWHDDFGVTISRVELDARSIEWRTARADSEELRLAVAVAFANGGNRSVTVLSVDARLRATYAPTDSTVIAAFRGRPVLPSPRGVLSGFSGPGADSLMRDSAILPCDEDVPPLLVQAGDVSAHRYFFKGEILRLLQERFPPGHPVQIFLEIESIDAKGGTFRSSVHVGQLVWNGLLAHCRPIAPLPRQLQLIPGGSSAPRPLRQTAFLPSSKTDVLLQSGDGHFRRIDTGFGGQPRRGGCFLAWEGPGGIMIEAFGENGVRDTLRFDP